MIQHGVPIEINSLFQRASASPPATPEVSKRLPMALCDSESPARALTSPALSASVGAHSPDTVIPSPKRRLGRKTSSDPPPPTSTGSGGQQLGEESQSTQTAVAVLASPVEEVPPPSGAAGLTEIAAAAKKRAGEAKTGQKEKAQRLASPVSAGSLKMQAGDEDSE